MLFYCLGSGMGHLTRAAAIARKLKRLIRGDIAIITNSAFHYLLEVEDLTCFYLKNLMEINDETASIIRSTIEKIDPELFIVDSYPVGINGELIPLLKSQTLKKAFIRRWVREDILTHDAMNDYAQRYFHLIIDSEPLPPLEHPVVVDCCPILIRDQDEILAPQMARDILLSKDSQKVLLGVTTGNREDSIAFCKYVESAFMQVRNENFTLRFASPHNLTDLTELNWYNIRYFPLFELFRGIDILIGNYSNNLFFESRALGVPTIFTVKDELACGQQDFSENQRVTRGGVEDLDRKMREIMENETPALATSFENNAQKAAAYLAHLLFSGGNLKEKDYKDRIQWFLL